MTVDGYTKLQVVLLTAIRTGDKSNSDDSMKSSLYSQSNPNNKTLTKLLQDTSRIFAGDLCFKCHKILLVYFRESSVDKKSISLYSTKLVR